MTRTRRGSLVIGTLLAVIALAGRADADDARVYLDKATAAFALNNFAAAAENYEKAFALKPDPAVLYNAAQAHRLGGNKQRALDLYQSYMRMYGSEKRAEIEKHIEDLKQAIEKDRAVATSPPRTPAPVGSTIQAQPPVAPAPKAGEPAPPVLVTQASPPSDDGSVVKKPWFWIVIGGAVVAGVVTVLLLTRSGPSDPTSSLSPVNGN